MTKATVTSDEMRELVEDFLHELDGWEQAYPLSAFPEPDLKRAAEVLKADGMTLDAISASNMRHVVSKIAPKARDTILALQAEIERCATGPWQQIGSFTPEPDQQYLVRGTLRLSIKLGRQIDGDNLFAAAIREGEG